MPDLSRLAIRDAKSVADPATGRTVFHVNDSHALTQAAGYLKHVCASDENIYFRGQSQLYGALSPSLFRGATHAFTHGKRISELQSVIGDVRLGAKIFERFHAVFYEPLLQHYGLKTTWLDLVDNVWVALWFACQNAIAGTRIPKYLHFETRNPDKEDSPSYVYILMIGTDKGQTPIPGLFKGPNTELVDLRVGCPSIFLRPHAQHGVLFRARGDSVRRPPDYSPFIRGVIRADLREALKWLGTGNLLNTHALMPPPFYDEGYRMLLDVDLPINPRVGTIQHIGA